MQLIVLLFIIQLCVISTLPCSNTLRLLFRTLDSWQINVQWYAFETKPKIFLVGISKFENGETVLNSSVSLFSHWRKLGSLLGDEKRGSHHLSIVNLPISSILKANKTNSKIFVFNICPLLTYLYHPFWKQTIQILKYFLLSFEQVDVR